MPKFAIMSPTHVRTRERKDYAWGNFKRGRYIAIGCIVCEDLTGLKMWEIEDIIKKFGYKPKEEKRRIEEFRRFLSLKCGDYVAIKNTNDGLFGIGVVNSDYYFKARGHDTGATNPQEFYHHFYKVNWLVTDYLKRKDIIGAGDKNWNPYGIINEPLPKIPDYIKIIFDRYNMK